MCEWKGYVAMLRAEGQPIDHEGSTKERSYIGSRNTTTKRESDTGNHGSQLRDKIENDHIEMNDK